MSLKLLACFLFYFFSYVREYVLSDSINVLESHYEGPHKTYILTWEQSSTSHQPFFIQKEVDEC
jgi:hypothetical protein